jgi:hypothetical protein
MAIPGVVAVAKGDLLPAVLVAALLLPLMVSLLLLLEVAGAAAQPVLLAKLFELVLVVEAGKRDAVAGVLNVESCSGIFSGDTRAAILEVAVIVEVDSGFAVRNADEPMFLLGWLLPFDDNAFLFDAFTKLLLFE